MRSVILIIGILFSVSINAQFILTEDFSGHTIGASVENALDKSDPKTGEWILIEKSTGTTVPRITSSQLNYSDYSFSNRGNTLQFLPTDGLTSAVFCISKIQLPYPCQPQGGFVKGSNEFYVAFLLNLGDTSADGIQEIFSFYKLDSQKRRGSLFCKLSSDKNSVSFSFQKDPNQPSSYWTKNYNKSNTHLILIKYSHVCINEKNLGHSEFDLFVNPNPSLTEEANKSLRISAFGNDSGFDSDLRYISFHQSGNTSMVIGGVRISNSFYDSLRGNETGISKIQNNSDHLFFTIGNKIFPYRICYGNIYLYDLSSKLQTISIVQGKSPIDTKLNPGIYLLKYEENNISYIQKIVIR